MKNILLQLSGVILFTTLVWIGFGIVSTIWNNWIDSLARIVWGW